MPIQDGGDSETWSITPNIPADDGYRHYVWAVNTGAVSAGTDVWVNNIQDAYRQTPPQPGIVQFNRDIAIAHDQTVYYSIGGTAVHGVQNADGTYTPANADYTGGTPVPGYNDLYSVTIPAGSAGAQVQFTPIVPYINPLEDPEKSINVVLSADPNPAGNVIAADAPGTATKPATTPIVEHGLGVNTLYLQGQMHDGEIDELVDQFDNSSPAIREAATNTLISELQQYPSGSSYAHLLDLLDQDANGSPETLSRINLVINKVWGYGMLTFGVDSKGRMAVAIPTVPNWVMPAGTASFGYIISSTGSSIVYHFGGPGQAQLGSTTADANTVQPLIYADVKNPGVSTLTVVVEFYDVNGVQLVDGRNNDSETLNVTIDAMQT